MVYDTIRKFSDIVVRYNVSKFKWAGNSYQLKGEIELVNHSQLWFRDYLFSDGSRKYSFQWQDVHGHCILRWDNAPHHQGKITTFPYHKHLGKEETVEDSPPMKLETVLEYIQKQLEQQAKLEF